MIDVGAVVGGFIHWAVFLLSVSTVSMSSSIVVGFLALAGGERVRTVKAGSTTAIYHCVYNTTIQTTSGVLFPASLRVYSPYKDVALPDNTVAFVIAKASIPASVPGETILLEAVRAVAVPGDPADDDYESRVPDFPHPVIIGLGLVSTPPRVLSDGSSKAFAVVSSDYVRDSRLETSVCCVFDSSRARWSKTPVPQHNSVIHYLGQFGGPVLDGGARVDLESIALNVGVQDDSVVSTPSKKRKFIAVVPPQQEKFSRETVSLPKDEVSREDDSGAAVGGKPSDVLATPAIDEQARGGVCDSVIRGNTSREAVSAADGVPPLVEEGESVPSSSTMSAINAGCAGVSDTFITRECRSPSSLSGPVSPTAAAANDVVCEDTALQKTRSKGKFRRS